MEISLKFNHVVRVNERKEKTMDYCDLGKRLRNERRKKKISQEQLAEMADCSVAHISHIETGNTNHTLSLHDALPISIPSLEILIRIINQLEISSDAILSDYVDKADHIYRKELSELLENCSEKEVKFIVEMAKENIRVFRKYGMKK